MRRTLMALAAVFLLLAGSLGAVSAQSGTPSTNQGRSTSGGLVPAGTAVTVIGSDGTASSTLTVDKLEDPFTGFDPSNPPQRGFHFVAADVSLFAAGSATITGGGTFYAIDTDGFLYQQAYVYRPSTDTTTQDFSNLSVDPGKEAKGAVYFSVLNGVKIAQIVYQPDYQRWITVLDQRSSAPKQGATVSIVDANGQPAADITVTAIADPMTDFDTSSPPQRGFEYAGFTVKIANTGAAALTVNPGDFLVVDADGFESPYYGVYRSDASTKANPDLQSGASIDPGKSVSGVVSYQLLKGSKINSILYAPSAGGNTQAVEIANLGAKGVQATSTPGPNALSTPVGDTSGGTEATPAGEATPSGAADSTGSSSDVPTPDLSGIDCNAVQTWAVKNLVPSLTTFGNVANDLGGWYADPTTLTDSTKVKADAKDLSAVIAAYDVKSAPSQVQPLAVAYQQVLQAFLDGLNKLATDVDAKAPASTIKTDIETIETGSSSLSDPNMQALSDALDAACPALANLGG